MANVDVQVVISAVDRASQTLKQFGDTANTIHGKFNDLVKASQVASFAFAGALVFTGKSILDVASDMQQAKVAFDTMLGSSEQASKTLKELSDFAKTTPFTFPEVVQGAKQLLAMGSSAGTVKEELKALGDISAGTKAPLERLIVNFGQVRLQGQLTGRELRDFAVNGVDVVGALAQQMGKTTAEIKDMVEAGEIGFDETKQAIMSMTQEGGRFFNLMDKQSQTFGGTISNIQDQLVRMAMNIAGISTEAETFGQVIAGGPFDLFTQALKRILDALNALEPQLQAFMQTFLNNGPAVGAVIGAITAGLLGATVALFSFLAPFIAIVAIGAAVGFAIAFVVQNLETLMPWLIAIGSALAVIGTYVLLTMIPAFIVWAATAVGAAIAVVVALGPVLLIAAAVAAIATLVYLAWRDNWFGIREKVQSAVDWFRNTVLPFFESTFGQTMLKVIDVVSGGWITKFNMIRDSVNGVVSAISGLISKAQELASRVTGGLKIPGFQTGGIVPGPIGQPQMAVVHGGEEVIPVGGGRGSGGSGMGINFNVSIGLYAGSETEKRNIARELYSGLVQIAQAQNKSVAELMGA